jgi:hypothetical protein
MNRWLIMKKQRKHYMFMATILLLTALISTLKFDMKAGSYWIIPCFLGFTGGVYIYAAVKTHH